MELVVNEENGSISTTCSNENFNAILWYINDLQIQYRAITITDKRGIEPDQETSEFGAYIVYPHYELKLFQLVAKP